MKRRIWLADAAGTVSATPLTSDSIYRDEEPMWSRDSKQILFCRLDNQDNKTAWVMDVSGSSLVKVAELYNDPGAFGDDESWFGYYGHIAWGKMLDWLR